MPRGVVKSFNATVGSGWIQVLGDAKHTTPVFVGRKDLSLDMGSISSLLPGQLVEFELVQRANGLSATNVVIKGMDSSRRAQW
jgi:cold shock CspA family protein